MSSVETSAPKPSPNAWFSGEPDTEERGDPAGELERRGPARRIQLQRGLHEAAHLGGAQRLEARCERSVGEQRQRGLHATGRGLKHTVARVRFTRRRRPSTRTFSGTRDRPHLRIPRRAARP